MSRRCDLTGKAVLTGHLVSHSNRKTKRRFLPNLCNVTLQSETLNRSVRMRISANALKSVDHRGGLDASEDGDAEQDREAPARSEDDVGLKPRSSRDAVRSKSVDYLAVAALPEQTA